MGRRWLLSCFCAIASSAIAQIQVELKFPRLQLIAYEPVVANITITNLAGRDVILHDRDDQSWFGFEITGDQGRSIAQISNAGTEPLSVASGKRVSRRVNLTPLFGLHDFRTYDVRAHVYFADLNKFYYSQAKVFEVTDARPIWQETVGVPEGNPAGGNIRTYSLMTNRFPDHTSLYIRVEDKDSGMVYATYSLGQIIAVDQPQAELHRSNRLHVLYCEGPRKWGYARIGLNGELLSRAGFAERKTRTRLVQADDGVVKIAGGTMETPLTQAARDSAPKLSDRPAHAPKDE